MDIKRFCSNSAFRFAIVGILNTLVGTIIMFIAYNLIGLNYWLSSASNYFFGSILSYFLNKYYTFRNKDKSIGELARFIINICVCYFLAYGIAKPMVIILLKNYNHKTIDNIAMVIGMGLFIIINYFGQKYFVFKNNKV